MSKRDTKIARNLRISWENWDFPSPKLRFSSHKIQFSSTAFRFPRNRRKSSSTAFQFLQRLSAFFNGFLLSKKSKKIFFNSFPLYSKHWTDTRSKQEKCAYQPMILDQRYSNVGLARPLVNISPSCSKVSIFKSLIPRLLISS